MKKILKDKIQLQFLMIHYFFQHNFYLKKFTIKKKKLNKQKEGFRNGYGTFFYKNGGKYEGFIF